MNRTLICILDHPTQYDPPLWNRMAQRGNLVPLVWYLHEGVPRDGEIQRSGTWSLPVATTYKSEVVENNKIISQIMNLSPPPRAILTSGWTQASTWRAVWAGKRLGLPVILSSDRINPAPKGLRMLLQPISLLHTLKNRLIFDGFFTTGSLGVEYLRSTGVRQTRIARGLYPVDVGWWQSRMASLHETSMEIRRWAGASAFVVLAVAKWAERENPLLILEAFARFMKEEPNARLVFVGDGPLRPVVEETIGRLTLKESVRCPGYVRYQDLAAYYGAADVFIHAPSHGPWELSVLEAMACGVPVVATKNVGAGYDLVVHGETGAIALQDDDKDLAEALAIVANTRNGKDAIRSKIMDRIRSFDVDSVSSELEALIDSLYTKNVSQ